MRTRILIVDDDELNVQILEELLGDEHELASADSGEGCLKKIREFAPDLVLLDIMMPGMDGYEACRQIKAAPHGDMTQVMLVSARASTEERLRGYEAGADDYVVKPFDHNELLAKVRVQFRLRGALTSLAAAHAKIEMYNSQLEHLVEERTCEVRETRDVAVFALAKLAESRDQDTGEHLERMRAYSQILAEHLSENGPYHDQINKEFLNDLYMSSPLHDIGKVGIPDAILQKPGKLTSEEFEIMKRHAAIGAEALESAIQLTKSGGFLGMGADIARSHHERFNGKGYPFGLQGTDIPLAARIVALADVYDALTSDRVYKSAIPPAQARAMIDAEKGEHFDPAIVDAFHACWAEFLAVRKATEEKQPDETEAVASDDVRR